MLIRLSLLLFLCSASLPTFSQQYNFRTYSLEEGLPQSEIRTIIQDSKKNIWLGTNGGGLCRFNGATFEVYTKKQGLPDNIIYSIYEDELGNLWIGTAKGLSRYDGYSFMNYGVEEGLPNGFVYLVNQDRKNNLVVLAIDNQNHRHLLVKKDESFIDFNSFTDKISNSNPPFSIMSTNDGTLMIITKKELLEFDGETVTSSSINDFPELNRRIIFPLLEDNNGFLWLGSAGKGYNKFHLYKDGRLKAVEIPDILKRTNVEDVIQDSKGNAWFCTSDNGVVKIIPKDGDLTNSKVISFNRQNGLPISSITSVLEDHEGNIWLATLGRGLLKYTSDQFVALNAEDGFDSEIIRAIYQDSKDVLWFGTADGALIKYEDNVVTNVLTEENTPLSFIRRMEELPNGNLLLGTLNGMWEYDGKRFIRVNHKFGVKKGYAVGDFLIQGGETWVATFGVGLVHKVNDKIEVINMKDNKIGSNNISQIFKDSRGNLWLSSTLNGVTRYQPRPIREEQDKDEGEIVTVFNSQNGLNNDYVLQVAEDRFGTLWFATFGGGLNIYDGKNITYLDSEDGLASDIIYSVLVDNDGNIWAGTQHGVDKITLNDKGAIIDIENFDKYDGFTGVETNGHANYIDKDGNLWFGTIKGAMRYKPDSKTFNEIPPVSRITDIKLFFKDVEWEEERYQKYYATTSPWFGIPKDLRLPHDKNHLTFTFEALSYKIPEKVQYQWKLKGLDRDWSLINGKTEAVYANIPPGSYTFMVRASNNDGVWAEEPTTFSFEILPPWYNTLWFRAFLLLAILGSIYTFYRWRINSIKERKEELEKQVVEKTAEITRQKDEISQQAHELQRSYQNLELLGEVGKAITSNLRIEKIVDTVYENVNALMDANVFWIGLYDDESRAINFRGAIEEGVRLPLFSYSIDEERLAIWCFKNKKEVFINDFDKEYKNYFDKKAAIIVGKPTKSIIYVPLISSGKCLGVISVQSFHKNAYSEYHLSLLRNIAIHARIALENASVYERISLQSESLREQKQLIEGKNEELTELNEEKNLLIGIVAHDLRNPLTSAITISNILKDNSEDLDEEQYQCVKHIVKSLNRMNDMVSRILNIRAVEDKKIELKMEETDLHEVLLHVKNSFMKAVKDKELELHLEVSTDDSVVKLDKTYATQVYENLISNAIKFSPNGKSIQIKLLGNNGTVRTEIIDEGPGFTEEDKVKLFKKFQQLSAKPTGGETSTGLGLSIVKKYVEAMKGKVWCESREGEGARFVVEFHKEVAVA